MSVMPTAMEPTKSQRPYSVIVFGATGFTGQRVLAELLNHGHNMSASIAAAGRSDSSLIALLERMDALNKCGVIGGVDVFNPDSLYDMATRGSLVINCVGPYRLYGEEVIKACIKAGTHYVDMCGEPEFIERMEFKYAEQAAAAGVYVVSSCGFDSIPGDYGTILAQRYFTAPAVPSSVEMYLTVQPGTAGYKINYATWQSAVLGVASAGTLRALRSQMKAAGKIPQATLVGPRPKAAAGKAFCGHPAVNKWHLPFPGCDASVVRRTQAGLTSAGEPAVHFVARVTMPSKFYIYVTMAVGLVLSTLSKVALGRYLLLNFPQLFSYGVVSRQGPSEAQIQGTKSITTLIAKGHRSGPPASPSTPPDSEVVLQIRAPDPGYVGTAIYIVQAALTILTERDKLPSPGILTPGLLLRNTSYKSRLEARGVEFQVSSNTLQTGSQ